MKIQNIDSYNDFKPFYKENLQNDLYINEQIKHCNLCQFCKIKKSNINIECKQTDIMFISMFFHRNFNDEFLSNFNKNFVYSSLIKCEPKYEVLDKFLAFINLQDSLRQCKNYILYEIKRNQPKIIVALGQEVFSTLVGQSNDAYCMIRGGLYRLNSTFIFPTHSLNYIQKNPSLKEEILADLTTIKGLI